VAETLEVSLDSTVSGVGDGGVWAIGDCGAGLVG
jgi:hypothetical protein